MTALNNTVETLKEMAALVRAAEVDCKIHPVSVEEMGPWLMYRLSTPINGDEFFLLKVSLRPLANPYKINSKEDVVNNVLFTVKCGGLTATGTIKEMKEAQSSLIDCSGYDYPERELVKARSTEMMEARMTRLLKLKERGLVQ